MKIIKNQNLKYETTSLGEFISVYSKEPFYEKAFEYGSIEGDFSFNACYRFNCCWMMPKIGTSVDQMPEEIQYMIIYDQEKYTMIFCLVDDTTRSSIFTSDGKLYIMAETGDMSTTVCQALSLYVISGEDPYKMVKQATKEIADKLKTFRLKKDKQAPQFMNYLGFCTYNAFYDQVSHDKIRLILEEFKNHQMKLGYLIVDAGWQNYDGNYIAGFEGDETKFPNGISETVKMAKQEYELKEILFWHTYNGFWSGMKKECFPEYDVEDRYFYIPKKMEKLMQKIESSDNTATAGMNFYPTNLIDAPCGFMNVDLFRFYFDFYSYLRKQGVSGSKLDAMAWIECFAQNKGGRVKMMRQLISSLEASSSVNFDGEHINCSSCSNDFIYNTLSSGVTRSSTDYFPDIPESHGLHILTNAHTSFWMGEIIYPDWDMFQSGNTAGEYHAMARAISGGPIYCTDTIGMSRFDIIRKLSTQDGRIGRCKTHGCITQDAMFLDPLVSHAPITIFNHNEYNHVLGAFNCSYQAEKDSSVTGQLSASMVYGIEGEKFAVYSYRDGFIGVYNKNETWETKLETFEANIYTIANIKNGYAIFGLIDKFNPGGFITETSYHDSLLEISLLEDGEVALYCERQPADICGSFTYENGLLRVQSNHCKVTLKF